MKMNDLAKQLGPTDQLVVCGDHVEVRYNGGRAVSYIIGQGGELWLTLVSNPPPGFFKVTNLYANAEGKLIVEYDDESG